MLYAFQTALAFRTGIRLDVLEDTYSWGRTEVWPYAVRAAVMTIRALGDLTGRPDIHDRIASAVRRLEGPD